jgi:hypothetical protein
VQIKRLVRLFAQHAHLQFFCVREIVVHKAPSVVLAANLVAAFFASAAQADGGTLSGEATAICHDTAGRLVCAQTIAYVSDELAGHPHTYPVSARFQTIKVSGAPQCPIESGSRAKVFASSCTSSPFGKNIMCCSE